MNDQHALSPWDPGAPPPALLRGTAAPGGEGELLSSPASGASCVHWRLRVFETLAAGVELVHEVMAPEPFDIFWRQEDTEPPRPVRLTSERVKVVAQPTLHPEGSPGAQSVARHFGLAGRVRVEEVLIRAGADLEAEGLLFDPLAAEQGLGPYRGHQGSAELFEATVRLPTSISLRPALLPWALGTAAALLTAAGATTAISKLRKLGIEDHVPAESHSPRGPQAGGDQWEPEPADEKALRSIGPKRPRRPRWP